MGHYDDQREAWNIENRQPYKPSQFTVEQRLIKIEKQLTEILSLLKKEWR